MDDLTYQKEKEIGRKLTVRKYTQKFLELGYSLEEVSIFFELSQEIITEILNDKALLLE